MIRPVSSETTSRLRWHAGLDAAAPGSGPSISDCTGSQGSAEGLGERACRSPCHTRRLNHELNGTIPSETSDSATEIPRDLAYAVAEITRFLRDASDNAPGSAETAAFASAAWLNETSWAAVLPAILTTWWNMWILSKLLANSDRRSTPPHLFRSLFQFERNSTPGTHRKPSKHGQSDRTRSGSAIS